MDDAPNPPADAFEDARRTQCGRLTVGGERFVVLREEMYDEILRRAGVILAEEFTEEEIAAIEATRMDPAYDHLNEELGDWKP